MVTKNLRLLTDWIITDSLGVCWHSSGQMVDRYELKNGELHGENKIWNYDGMLRFHEIWEDGEFVKTML